MWPVCLLVAAWLVAGLLVTDARSVDRVETAEGGMGGSFILGPPIPVVQGRITAREGTPIAGAYVEPRSLDRPRARIPDVGNVSGADGRYEWPLPAGTYEVSVSAEGYRRESRRVTLRAGETATLDFTLTRTR